VGHAAAFTHVLTVPGASVASAGVTWVGVAPTHRRRGVFSALMNHLLATLSSSGEPVAALWASETGIYRRFGYGVASRKAVVTVPRLPRPTPSPPGLRVVLGSVEDGLADCVDVYERERLRCPGMISRSPQAWRETSPDERDKRGGASALHCARVLDEAGRAQGYAWFRTRPDGSARRSTTSYAYVWCASTRPCRPARTPWRSTSCSTLATWPAATSATTT
jgi:predicted acetyltransferase